METVHCSELKFDIGKSGSNECVFGTLILGVLEKVVECVSQGAHFSTDVDRNNLTQDLLVDGNDPN